MTRLPRAVSVLALALAAAVLIVGVSPGATRFLTKKQAKKLFYTKATAESRFLDQAEANAAFLDLAEANAAFLDLAEANAAFLDQAEADALYVGETEARTGHVSCSAITWQEAQNDQGFAINAGMRFVQPGGTDGLFSCDLRIPHGATVTAARFTLTDNSVSERVTCGLNRLDLVTGVGYTAMAQVATGLAAQLGVQRLTDDTITTPTIDNDAFAYNLSCFVEGEGTDVGFSGASVDYTVTGGQGAAS